MTKNQRTPFYHKRFIEEKEVRINYLFDPESVGTAEDALKDINDEEE